MTKVLKKLEINWRNGSGAYRLLMDKAKLLASTEEGCTFDLEEADEVIEELETLVFYINNFDTRMLRIVDDLEGLSPTLASALVQLKERVFRYQALPRLCELADEGPKLCQYCYWAMNRMDRGRNNALLNRKIANAIHGGSEYTHLCAIDNSPTLPSLEKRSLEGCVLCSYLRGHFLISLQEQPIGDNLFGKKDEPFYAWLLFDWEDKPVYEPMQSQWNGNTLRFITLKVSRHGAEPEEARKLRFHVGSSDSRLSARIGSLSPPRPTPLDPVNLTLIQKCLRAAAHKAVDIRFIPKRLLDLGLSDEYLPRIVDAAMAHTSHNDQPVEYVALSYCWGSPVDARRQLLLTAESKESLYTEITIDRLTPVVQDAVTTCRALGFRFLWVDALCILQDDATDWEEQSYDMEKVFANSALTICATAASSCLDSFLKRTHARLDLALASANGASPAKIITLLPCSNDKRRSFYTGIHQRNLQAPLDIDLWISPWSLRGWIFQERMLAPKKLYFGVDMIHIHVDNVITSENGYLFEDKVDHERNRILQARYSVTRDEILSHSDLFPDLWYQVIYVFATLQWTNPTDLLPGLAGIARVFQDVYKDDYVAGLWVNDIECGLLWNVIYPEVMAFGDLLQTLSSMEPYIGPSWSWHSVFVGLGAMSGLNYVTYVLRAM